MRKVYAYVTGLVFILVAMKTNAQDPAIFNYNPNDAGKYNIPYILTNQPGSTGEVDELTETEFISTEVEDSCRANFETSGTISSLLTKTFTAIPWHSNQNRPVLICWNFGDGTDTCIEYSNTNPGPFTVTHTYEHPGVYEVCVKIVYQGGCEARKCKEIIVGEFCRADFEKLSISQAINSLYVTFRALPWHSNNKKPRVICWRFGDGKDTCIEYPENYTGSYIVRHKYPEAGNYEVCVKITYFGGCEAYKCKLVRVENLDICRADFVRIPFTATSHPFTVYLKALPWHSNNKKPQRVCWKFGDGRDTCIEYPANYTGSYVVRHTYREPGNYNVCVKIRYYGGCEADKCKYLQVGNPDKCRADFQKIPVSADHPLVVGFKALPWHNNNKKPKVICWSFGDGQDTCVEYAQNFSGPYTIRHRYQQPGVYNVCIRIIYYGGCEARKCKPIVVPAPDECRADFERIPILTSDNILKTAFRAIPWHNNNKKPKLICWKFGDGKDTCIEYPADYTGGYTVHHTYPEPGNYEVCVKILYYGGCEARKCKLIQVGHPDECRADFERIPILNADHPWVVVFKALPWHNNNKKPKLICWDFGDGRDTCIEYSPDYTGDYSVRHWYREPGNYEVCVKILYYGGCEARKCKVIKVGEAECLANFERLPATTNIGLLTYFKALPWHHENKKPKVICWEFGDGKDTCIEYPENYTGQYVVSHFYREPGRYEVCIKILYYGGCEARKCKPIEIGHPDECRADFERIPIDNADNSLVVGFRALPWHHDNKKPLVICWNFGDGKDTCIEYPENYTGQYIVTHHYEHPGEYEVCVKIKYYGGCEARKCRVIIIPGPDVCRVKLFEITPSITSLMRGFYAAPWHSNNKRPILVCWNFGDGTDTCIQLNALNPPPANLFIRHTYPGPGEYRACVKLVFQGGCIAYDCDEVIIRPATNVCGGFMTDSITGPRTFKFKGYAIHNPNDPVIGYPWTFGDGTGAIGREVTHTYNHAGTYEVCLYIKTERGCETRICKKITVPGNAEPALQLAPNPVLNVLYALFYSTHTEPVNIKIVNANGVVVRNYVRNATAGANNWNFDVSTLLPGIYTFVVYSPNQLSSGIFIKN